MSEKNLTTFEKIKHNVEYFTHSEPPKGFEWEYLLRSKEMLSLYEQARAILEESSSEDSCSKELECLLDEINRLM